MPDMDIPAELCLELLMAADYFDGKLRAIDLAWFLQCRNADRT